MPKRSRDKPSTSSKRSSSSTPVSSDNYDDKDLRVQTLLLEQYERTKRPKPLLKQLCESYKAARESRERYIEETRRSDSSSEGEAKASTSSKRRSSKCTTTTPSSTTDTEKKDSKLKEYQEIERRMSDAAVEFWLTSTEPGEFRQWRIVEEIHTGVTRRRVRAAILKVMRNQEEAAKALAREPEAGPTRRVICLECESSDCDEVQIVIEKQDIEKSEKIKTSEVNNDNVVLAEAASAQVKDSEQSKVPVEIKEEGNVEVTENEGDITTSAVDSYVPAKIDKATSTQDDHEFKPPAIFSPTTDALLKASVEKYCRLLIQENVATTSDSQVEPQPIIKVNTEGDTEADEDSGANPLDENTETASSSQLKAEDTTTFNIGEPSKADEASGAVKKKIETTINEEDLSELHPGATPRSDEQSDMNQHSDEEQQFEDVEKIQKSDSSSSI